jgi:hypothetical protein
VRSRSARAASGHGRRATRSYRAARAPARFERVRSLRHPVRLSGPGRCAASPRSGPPATAARACESPPGASPTSPPARRQTPPVPGARSAGPVPGVSPVPGQLLPPDRVRPLEARGNIEERDQSPPHVQRAHRIVEGANRAPSSRAVSCVDSPRSSATRIRTSSLFSVLSFRRQLAAPNWRRDPSSRKRRRRHDSEERGGRREPTGARSEREIA